MEFTPVVNHEGWTYHYTTEENPIIYRNAEFDGLTIKVNLKDVPKNVHIVFLVQSLETIHIILMMLLLIINLLIN